VGRGEVRPRHEKSGEVTSRMSTRWNYRNKLMDGIWNRIEREHSPSRLMLLWGWLWDAADLPTHRS
jgi:hypothetical protein